MTKDQKDTIGMYMMFSAGIIMNFVPVIEAQLLGFVMIVVALIGAYLYKAKSKLDSLTYNHMTYLTGTIWISSFLLLIGMIIAVTWVYQLGDHAMIMNVVTGVNNGVLFTQDELETVMRNYIQRNMTLLITATGTTLGPGLIYIIYRVTNGMRLAVRGDRFDKPARWL